MSDKASSQWVRNVTEASFQKEVIEASRAKPVVVDFWAEWCGPCKLLAPVLENLVKRRKGEVILAKVNIDDHPGLAQQFRVSSIPLVLAFRNGKVIRDFVGLLPEPILERFLDAICPTDAERLADKAHDLEAKSPAAAEKDYRQAIAEDRNNEAARVGLARVLLAQGKLDEIEDVLEPVGTEGEPGEEAQRIKAVVYFRRKAKDLGGEAAARKRLAAAPETARARLELGLALAAEGKYAEALPELLQTGERDVKLASSEVREAMVQVFYALGAHHALANEYRAKLARLLY